MERGEKCDSSITFENDMFDNVEGSILRYHVNDRTISKRLYWEIVQSNPALQNNLGYRRLFAYLALGPHMNGKGKGTILVPHTELARMAGKQPKKFLARQFLEDFKRDVLPALEYSRYSAKDGICRAILNTGIDELLQQRLCEDNDNERAYIGSGKAFNRSNQRTLYQHQLQLNQIRLESALYKDQQMIGAYLHNLPLSLFNNLVEKNYYEAWSVTKQLKLDNEEDRQRLHINLQAIRDMPFPFYHPVGNNARLFSSGLTTIKKEVRQALCKGLIDLDLSSCQCAIAAGMWQINSIQKILRSGGSIWDTIFDYMEIEQGLRGIAKPILKEALYSLMYGKHPSNVEGDITKAFQGYARKGQKVKWVAHTAIPKEKRFIDCPVVVDLITAIGQAKQDILRDGGYNGAYGYLPYGENEDINSFLSCVMQSYELSIIASCFKLAMQRKDFRIVLYQYDGITVEILRKDRASSILAAIQEKSKQKALSLGIVTSLASSEVAA